MRVGGCVFAGALCAMALWGAGATPESKLDLRGRITGTGRSRMMRVTLFGVDSPFTASTLTDPGGEFHFHSLPAGTYTLSILRRSIGEIRRTVVVTASLADRKGAVRVTIPYTASEAVAAKTGGLISKKQLAISSRAVRYFEEAQNRLTKHDVAGGRKSLEKAVAADPRYSAAWNSLGVIAYQTGNAEAAEEYFRKSLDAEPEAYEPTVNLGGLLLAVGRYKEALPYNQKAVAERSNDALANVQAGISYFELGDPDKAEPALKLAERADPAHFSRPQLFLSKIYLMRGERDAARRELEDCVAQHPDDRDTERLRAQIRELEAH